MAQNEHSPLVVGSENRRCFECCQVARGVPVSGILPPGRTVSGTHPPLYESLEQGNAVDEILDPLFKSFQPGLQRDDL